MSPEIASHKAILRTEMLKRLREIPPARRAAASASLRSLFDHSVRLTSARSILFFAPLSLEPNVWPLIESALASAITVALPRFHPATQTYHAAQVKDLAVDILPGAWGVHEAAPNCPEFPLNRLDLVLVPGVAFDAQGRRLGRGKGHYDRLLAQVCGTTCGVAFDEQIVETVPVAPHDVRLNCILTPTRLIET